MPAGRGWSITNSRSHTRRHSVLICLLSSQSACNIFIDVDCSGLKHDTATAASLVNLVENLLAGNLTTGRVQCCVVSRYFSKLHR